jgi:DnaJ-domain-containing protein 1
MAWVWILLGIIYILSPYDLIPDFIPVRGWIDDLIVLILMIRYLKRRKRQAVWQDEGESAASGYRENAGDDGPTVDRPQSPHEILGVSPHAEREEIRAAYLGLAGRYHPDKVAHLGKEFQEMAEKRFKEIQNAYDRLMKP